jgi:hypothetical protein
MTYSLGRLHAPDARDSAYPMRAVLAAPTARLTRYWNDTGWFGFQGPYPYCVGYAWSHWLADGPRTDRAMAEGGTQYAVDLYQAAQFVDEWPGVDYDGTSVRAGAKVLKARSRIVSYHWAQTVEDVVQAVLDMGPVVVGTAWTAGMFEPVNDVIRDTGPVVGGHAYLLNGVTLKKGLFRVKNSWGRSWAGDGRAWLEIETFERLLAEDGEACLAIEAT